MFGKLKSRSFSSLSIFWHAWKSYSLYVESIAEKHPSKQRRNISYWQDKLFTKVIRYALPLGLLILLPTVIIEYQHGDLLIAFVDVMSLFLVALVTLNGKLAYLFRKCFVVVVLVLFSVVKIAALGSFGIGSIYLLALSVFMSLSFSKALAYLSVVLNLLICAGFALIIGFHFLELPIMGRYSLGSWLIYSLNFLFVDLILVMLVLYVVHGLENSIKDSDTLFIRLATELDEKIERNNLLEESETHYKSLFFLNPSPMLIYDPSNLKFLQVNGAAIMRYGYTEQEFSAMKIDSILPEHEQNQYLLAMGNENQANLGFQNINKHLSKSGETFIAELKVSPIVFRGINARLCIIRDITAEMEHSAAIEEQHKKLKQIAYMQSHVIRAPLARVLGLVDLLKLEHDHQTHEQLLTHLENSAKELDEMIKEIVKQT